MNKKDKPNCYECIHRGGVPGDAHSCCQHPETGTENTDMMSGLVAILSGESGQAIKKLGITANAHGVRSGWFLWPANFDPVWLETCNGFTSETKEKTHDKAS